MFGLLDEDQVGLNPMTGRPRISEDVLEGIRQYLLVANGEERLIREARVRTSLADLKKDPLAQKTMLMLKPALLVSKDLDKGKCLVFDFAFKNALS